MNYKIIVVLAILLLITSGAMAYSYYAPIETDNKLTIYGETDRIYCGKEECVYKYSITNNDSIAHLINITPYFDSTLATQATTIQFSLVQRQYDYEECVSWIEGAPDKNGDKTQICNKYQRTNQTYTEEVPVKPLTTNNSKTPSNELAISTDQFVGSVLPNTTNQDTINAGETKYFKITFKPTKKTGELVLTSKSDAVPTIKGSLDPPYTLGGDFEDFEDGDYTLNPTWNINSGTPRVETWAKYNGNYGLTSTNLNVSMDYNLKNTDYNSFSFYLNCMSGATQTQNSHHAVGIRWDTINYDNMVWIDFINNDGADGTDCQILTQSYIGGVVKLYNWGYQYEADQNHWIRGEIYPKNDGTAEIYVYDANGQLMDSNTAVAVPAGYPTELFYYKENNIGRILDYIRTAGSTYSITPNITVTEDKTTATLTLTNSSIDTNVTESDWNWTVNGLTTGITNPDANNTTYTLAEEKKDYNVCLAVGGLAADLNWKSAYTCETFTTTKWFGDTNFYFFDETTGVATSATIDFNGTSYTGTSFYLPTKQILDDYNTGSTTQYTFTITKANYGTRYYVIDLNKYSDLNIGFKMLSTANAGTTNTINMQFYDSTGTTTAQETYVTAMKGTYVVGRDKTDSSGYIEFFLDEIDTNYTFYLDGDYNTQMGTVLIYRPKAEETNLNIDGNWLITMTGSTATSPYKIQTNSQIIYILPNKREAYNFNICMLADGNIETKTDCDTTNYESRNYVAMTYGDADGITETIQPYLTGNAVEYKISIKEKITEKPLRFATVTIYDTESGDKVITSILTDEDGEASVNLAPTKKYFFSIIDETGTQRYGSKGITSTRIAIWAITGEDMVVWVDYQRSNYLTEAYGIQYGMAGGIKYDFNASGGSIVDLNTPIYIWARVYEYGNEIRIRLYKNDILQAPDVNINTSGILDYDTDYWFYTDSNYDTNYTIQILKNNIVIRTWTVKNISYGERAQITDLLVTNNNLTFILIIVIVTLAIIIGQLIPGQGLNALLIMCIMLSAMTWAGGGIGVLVAGILGVLHFGLPLIREQFKS